MAQIRGTAGYNLGNPQFGGQQFGGGQYGTGQFSTGGMRAEASDPSPLEAIRAQTGRIEDMLDTLSEPVKP